MKIFKSSSLTEKELKPLAVKTGLININPNTEYMFCKVGEKKVSSMGYPSRMLALERGDVSLVGATKDGTDHIWIVITNQDEWYKTSPVLSCLKQENNIFLIETENSYYELIPLASNKA